MYTAAVTAMIVPIEAMVSCGVKYLPSRTEHNLTVIRNPVGTVKARISHFLSGILLCVWRWIFRSHSAVKVAKANTWNIVFGKGRSSAKFACRRFVMPKIIIPATKRAADQKVKKEISNKPVNTPAKFAAISIASQVRPTKLWTTSSIAPYPVTIKSTHQTAALRQLTFSSGRIANQNRNVKRRYARKWRHLSETPALWTYWGIGICARTKSVSQYKTSKILIILCLHDIDIVMFRRVLFFSIVYAFSSILHEKEHYVTFSFVKNIINFPSCLDLL